MLEDGFTIHEGAERMILSLSRWAWKDDEWKDLNDALRYATWPWAMHTKGWYDPPTVRVR